MAHYTAKLCQGNGTNGIDLQMLYI